jgi:hypothetical protein
MTLEMDEVPRQANLTTWWNLPRTLNIFAQESRESVSVIPSFVRYEYFCGKGIVMILIIIVNVY